MSSIKIVFTGGPCGGKTELIEKTKEYLKKEGYNVMLCPEAATQIFEMGINLKNSKDVIRFQKTIFKKQLFNEKLIEKTLIQNKEEKYIILYDRGVLDNKAYCENSKNFDKIVNIQNIQELYFLDSYDLVLDLITTANGAEEKYNLYTNKQRMETIKEAKIIDQKTSNAWTGHRNIKIINSTISLDEAFELIKRHINNLIKEKEIKEKNIIEIDNNIDDFKNYNDDNSRLINIQKIILNKDDSDIKYVLYKRTYKDFSTYIFKVYKKEDSKEIIYCNKLISLKEYLDLLYKYKIKELIWYKKLSFIKDKQLYEINFYKDKTVLEYEENKLNKDITLPEEVKVIKNEELKKVKKHDSIN